MKNYISLLFSLIAFSFIAISVVIISFLTIFPFIITDNILRRPYEIPSLILFSISLLFFYKKKLYKINDAFFKAILVENGFDIDVFNDPLEALKNFKSQMYDLVLIDVRMPKMNVLNYAKS